MKTYVALLRGINVGGNHKVEMLKLKKVFESLGFTDLVTYINSGNVIFNKEDAVNKADLEQSDPARLARTIETALENKFGFEIKTIVIEAAALKKISASIPIEWKNDDTMKTDVLFLYDVFDKKDTLGLIFQNPAVDTLKYVEGAIIWSVPRAGASKSGMKKFIGTLVYKNMTARNVNTVRKLAEMAK